MSTIMIITSEANIKNRRVIVSASQTIIPIIVSSITHSWSNGDLVAYTKIHSGIYGHTPCGNTYTKIGLGKSSTRFKPLGLAHVTYAGNQCGHQKNFFE